ncbi:MAG: hypothetical protein M3N38_02925 [Pseudomonadota bacterium]|nr:hypothetical protein [Pseudomonadota bacterium]
MIFKRKAVLAIDRLSAFMVPRLRGDDEWAVQGEPYVSGAAAARVNTMVTCVPCPGLA